MRTALTALVITLLILPACKENTVSTSRLSPAAALSTFQLPEGFKIELVASEPLIADPVAMEIDEYGNLFVVEMHGYPLDTAGSGAIKLLTDTNRDGIPDKSVVFADHLRLPTGIMKWKKGILVVDVPEILYLEDTNNDGSADIRKPILTGLALTNPQHIANTPIYGLDGWIYVAHMGIITPKVAMAFSDTGSNVRFVSLPGSQHLPRDANGRNIRFKPDSGELEMLAGESQYGHTFDNWGHHIGTSNADHLFHEVMAARYMQRNKNLLISDAADFIPDHGDAAEVYPITKNPQHQLLTDVGVITSSCGVTWYQGGLFPDSFNNVTFIAEPVHNLVHADRIYDKGATFQASRVYQNKEFLASTDAWFRPVQFYIGPDGALYVIDYYREIIEHPEWMSDSINNSGALYKGSDQGRIYRITPDKAAKMDWSGNISLFKATPVELVSFLGANNIWWRRNAQRLLVDRNEGSTIAALKQFIDTTRSAAGVVHALWTLEALHATDETVIKKALHHPVNGVRENAILLSELHTNEKPGLISELLTLKNDSSAKVRYQLLCSLGNISSPEAERTRQELLLKDIEDKWVQIAALSSSGGNEWALIKNIIPAVSAKPSEGKKLFFEHCASVIGMSGNTPEIKKLIAMATADNQKGAAWWQSSCLKGLAKALNDSRGKPAGLTREKELLLSQFRADIPPMVRSAALGLMPLLGVERNKSWEQAIKKARVVAMDSKADVDFRNDALRLLALDRDKDHSVILEQLVSPQEPETLQQTALISYNQLSAKAACSFIIRSWKFLTPQVRDVVMGIFLSSVENMHALLDALQKNQIQRTAISWPRMVELMNNDDLVVRKRARDLLAGQIESRSKVLKNYAAALSKEGDASKGSQVFKNVCGSCHQVGGKYGTAFGPDLASIRNRDAGIILADIIDPNRAIADKFETWNIVKKNGEKLNGIIASETPTNISVRNLGGQQRILPRTDLKSIEASTTSAMPVGLEASISVEEMSNLLAFLKNTQ